MIRRHASKFDAWLVALIGGCLVLAAGLVIFASGKEIPNLGLRLAIGLFPAVVTALMMFPLHYKIGNGQLAIRCGLMSIKVPVNDIESVKATRSSLSAPAMSLDRLDVEYRKGNKTKHVMISPADKMNFLTDLAVAAPHLRRAGEALLPRASS